MNISIDNHNRDYRSQHKQQKVANQIIRSRLWAIQNGYGRSDKEVAVYDLGDDEIYPYELQDIREVLSD